MKYSKPMNKKLHFLADLVLRSPQISIAFAAGAGG